MIKAPQALIKDERISAEKKNDTAMASTSIKHKLMKTGTYFLMAQFQYS